MAGDRIVIACTAVATNDRTCELALGHPGPHIRHMTDADFDPGLPVSEYWAGARWAFEWPNPTAMAPVVSGISGGDTGTPASNAP